jgi:hypothetical protein
MAVIEQTHSENKTETLASAMQAAGLTPMEQRVEDERQEFDVRYLMQLQREGKPFRKYLDDDSDIIGADADMPVKAWAAYRGFIPRLKLSPRGRLMFHYLEEMQRQARAGIAAALEEAPIVEALEREDLLYWWGASERDLLCMVGAWGEHARDCKAKGEPIPTPAYWLLTQRRPSRIEDPKAILEGVQQILVAFIVGTDEVENPYVTKLGTEALRGRRLS